jgi:amino acid adenylation domain-containing protein/non-ribosomal peptide synthase protein (TIGR01720 family)
MSINSAKDILMNFSTIIDVLQWRAKNQPNKIGYVFLNDGEIESASLTYRELDYRAKLVATLLIRYARPGDRALLIYPPGLDFIIAFFGCLYAGVVAVPVDMPRRNQRTQRLQKIVSDAQSSTILTVAEVLPTLENSFPRDSGTQLLATDGIAIEGVELFEASEISADTLAFLQYTSGSTGNPKGVMVSHGNLMHNEEMMKVGFRHNEQTVLVGWLPLFHDMGLILDALQPLYLGGTSIMMPPIAFLQKPYRWLKAISDYRGTTSGGPNFAYDLCLRKITPEQINELDLSSWSLAFNGAEPIRNETLEQFTEIFGKCGFNPAGLYPCYGMAETTLFTSGDLKATRSVVRQVDTAALLENKIIIPSSLPAENNKLTSIVSCGRVWLDSEIAIVDPELLTRCASDRVGEIWVASGSVAQGYWNRPEDTKQIFQAQIADDERERQFLRTGDLGFIHDGELFVTGRLKDVIIIRGRNHYPQDIELTTANCQPSLAIDSGAAFTVEISGEEKLVIAQEVERSQRRQIDREEIETAVLAAVSEQHQLQVDALLLLKPGTIPKTSSGKIQRRACRQAFLDNTFDLVVEPSELFSSTRNPDRVDIDKSAQLASVENSARFKLEHDKDRQIKTPSPVANPVLMTLVINAIRQQVALTLAKPIDRIFAACNFHSFGTDSLKAVEIIGNLSQYLELQLSPTLLFEHSTPAELAAHLVQTDGEHLSAKFLAPPPDVDVPTTSDPDDRRQPANVNASGDIAVISMSCRFPQAPDLDSYWQLLANGDNAITEVPIQRWARNWYDANPDTANKTYSRWGGFIDDVDLFDPLFFQISPREAELMDPQQRIFLEVVWEALEHAGYRPEQLESDRVGVFVGCSNNGYYRRIEGQLQAADYSAGIGNQNPIIANRVSFLLNLRGPSVLVDTLCSSSLVSLHMACQSIRQGECNVAIAGGVNLQLSPEYYVGMSRMKVHSPTGQCYAFDDRADGIVLGEGAGAVLLKPLERAIADGDRICGVIKGSAVNNDGRTNGLTAPNPASQADVIRTALDNAGVSAETISYVEAHGTGTTLGDPIEVEGLTQAFRVDTDQNQFCAIGSVKTNLGHLESATGIAQFIKVLLSLQHQQLPPSLNFERPNPYIPFDTSPFVVNNQLQQWESTTPRRAGISSFGMGGTNAHVVVEEAPTLQEIQNQVDRSHHLLMLSAKSEKALAELVDRYHQLLTDRPDLSLADLCFTANTGRVQFNERLGIVTDSIKHLTAQLTAYQQQQQTSNIYRGSSQKKTTAKIAYLFTGQGSLSVKMGRQLYETQPTFRQAIAACAVLMEPHLDQPLLSILYPVNGRNELIDRTIYAQPALFALEYALFKLWQSWGITPTAVLGHSFGEYVAAVVAGVMSLADGIKLVTTRARLMQNLPTVGKMVAVFAPPAEIQKVIKIDGRQLTFAVYNSPENTVIAGDKPAISHACEALAINGISFKPLDTTNAFHSPLMEPMLPEFQQLAATISYDPPQIPLISNLTGNRVDKIDAEYWCQQLRQSVRFVDGIQALAELEIDIFLEIGPKPTLLAIGQQCLPVDDNRLWLSSLRGIADGVQMLHSLAELAVNGVEIDWSGFDRDYTRQRVSLPTYPFQRKSYWIATASASAQPSPDKPLTQPAPVNSHIARTTNDRYQQILTQLHTATAQMLKANLAEIDIHAPFLEMGADSLVLMEAVSYVGQTYGLKIGIRQLFEELTTVAALANYIDRQLPAVPVPVEIPAVSSPTTSAPSPLSNEQKITTPAIAVGDTALERIMQQQMQLVSDVIGQQLAVFKGSPEQSKTVVQSVPKNPSPPPAPTLPAIATQPPQPEYLQQFIAEYTKQTTTSKAIAQSTRSVLADSRASAGFRPSTKELVYPIVGDRAAGSRIWDVDGNEYIDLTMGFGVLLFGHAPKFIHEALVAQLDRGLQIGPQAKLAGEVAQLITELTGTERAAFCNSGTEAVMTALRLARTTTGRHKIALFADSYHGHFDGILAKVNTADGSISPSAAGIPDPMVADVLVLEYGDPAALEILRSHAPELAAVLVEPVQSRHPELQPREFLHQLRQLTSGSGTALIFDEVLIGFRIDRGGAQAWFDIQADIITYGKIVGGGLPIGVVAGKSKFLDGIDGGYWNYGDASYPAAEKTFFAGTFNKNHLGMVVARATLQYLKAEGPSLQAKLNQKTHRLATTLNDYFKQMGVPMQVVHFGSLFRFSFNGNFDLFFYHLLAKGIYVWEGRSCFLSTAHTDADIDRVIQAVQASVDELQQMGAISKTNSQSAVSRSIPSSVSSPKLAHQSFNPDEPLPLSFAQQRLWFLAQLEPDSALYNLPVAVSLHGQLQVDVLTKCIQSLIQRHAILRTNFLTQADGQAQQVVHPHLSWQLELVDLQSVPHTERSDEISRLSHMEAEHRFDLEHEPLVRATLLVLAPTEHLLLLTLHHIVADGWSTGIFLTEIAALYPALLQGLPSPLPELAIQYADFALWQRQWLQGEVLEQQLAYWQQQLANAPTLLELPSDRPRPPAQSFQGARHVCPIPESIAAGISTISSQNGVTPFMTLLAAFDVLLYRYTGQTDILVGSPIANRNHQEIEDLIGFFVNTLVLRGDLAGNPTFRELVTKVKQMALDAYTHQDLPFDLLVERIQPERDLSYTPLFQVMFALEKDSMAEIDLPDLQLKPVELDTATAKFDLSLDLIQTKAGLVGKWEYNTDLFDALTIARMAEHFETLLSGIITNPDQQISTLPILSAAEQQLLSDWNDTQTDTNLDRCIHQLFERQVEQTPDAVAVVYENDRLTYRELNDRANQLAHYLVGLGTKTATSIGLCVERSIETIVGVLAVLKAGGTYVPLDPDYPVERLAYLLSDSQTSVLLTQERLLDRLPPHHDRVVCLDTHRSRISGASTENLGMSIAPESLAYVIYTSGSTGQPKGVMIPHQNLVNAYDGWERAYELRSGCNTHLQMASFSFDVFAGDWVRSLCSGGCLVLCPRSFLLQPDKLYELMQSTQVNCGEFVPVVFRQLIQYLERTDRRLDFMKLAIVGSDSWSVKEYHQFQRVLGADTRLINSYGVTEATIDSTYFESKKLDACGEGLVPIGVPFANIRVYILDSYLQPVPIGVSGELHIGGAGLAQGYLHRPELTAEKFITNPFSDDRDARLYKTGDLARYLPDGNIEYLGRIDAQVKIRGFRIELGEVESAISKHPSVSQVTVIDREDRASNKQLVAYVVLLPTQQLTYLEMRAFLQQQLPDYTIPTALVCLAELPLTPNGKIDRQVLPAPSESETSLKGSFVSPRNNTEQILADLWAEVLGRKQVGIHDNFFELGGDSILSIQILARAHQSGLHFTPKQLFQHQTIAELSAVMGTEPTILAQQGLVTGSVPLTPIQHWFFEQNLPEPHHYNQAVLLEVESDLKPELLQQAIQQLQLHHDALRLRFRQVESGWQQVNATPDAETIPFQFLDLSNLTSDRQRSILMETAAQLQAGLNLSVGPIVSTALVRFSNNEPSRLLLVVHHLAVDGVSWRILLEDLARAYQQISQGEAIQLLPKTTAFQDWAQQLVSYSRSAELAAELNYWLTQLPTNAALLPVDYPLTADANTEASAAIVSVCLSVEQTHDLLQKVPAAYNTQINDVLLTALAQSFAQWTSQRSLPIELEGHGREDLFKDVDLSRTVGWYTSEFPVVLSLGASGDPEEDLKLVKEQLRRIPNGGIGYGILRYLSPDREIRSQLGNLPPAQVIFNYLGRLDRLQWASPLLGFAPESSGPAHSLVGKRSHLLEVDGFITADRLRMEFTYSQNIHKQVTVEHLAQAFLQALTNLIDRCQASTTKGYTPSDFSAARLNQQQLDRFMDKIRLPKTH